MKGLRKICEHKRWDRCDCPWHFHFKWKAARHRFSLNKYLGLAVINQQDAETHAGDLRKAIKGGQFGLPTPVEHLTMRQLADQYLKQKVAVKNAKTKGAFEYSLDTIFETKVPTVTGGTLPFGQWRAADVRTNSIELYREARLQRTGFVGVNRHLGVLRTMFKWGVLNGYLQHTPFRVHGEVAISLPKEPPRVRRLEGDEEARLFTACAQPLRAIVECALETGMRKGEILSLQWSQVQGMKVEDGAITWAPNSRLALTSDKTKTKTHRAIPISSRLKAILDMRRFDPAGDPHPLTAYVFGTPFGARRLEFTRAWYTAVLRSHDHTPTYTATKGLSADSRAALKQIDLHFHDLRREAGSRWLDFGVPIHDIRNWLGHTNVSQTSTYLQSTATTSHSAMAQYEARKSRLSFLGTNGATGGNQTLSTATGGDEKPSKTTEGHGPTIM